MKRTINKSKVISGTLTNYIPPFLSHDIMNTIIKACCILLYFTIVISIISCMQQSLMPINKHQYCIEVLKAIPPHACSKVWSIEIKGNLLNLDLRYSYHIC